MDASTENGLHITCYLSDVFDLVDSIPTAYRQTVIISRQAVIQEGCYLYRNEDIPQSIDSIIILYKQNGVS